ncbi:S8 family serine peptidase [Rubrivivax gelatinosus]|uniref:Serine protease n=1 Tax=Rubrivivax gelatinosus TaxID=28068 RepID=A0A4R2MXU6_RUBGE|nr:S8 family serine peptidase [Rubrivivax gelatinosus]MBK1688260.1 protease [Rubrivivax gelatinosus]TCP05533.1 serine protease [Rubrivivax gelatinosus]
MGDEYRSRRLHRARLALLLATLTTLAACGGGGGGGDDGADGYTVSGTLSVSANLVVDGDTNDPNQARVPNDDSAAAQLIAATSQVMGTVNLAATGAEGANYDAGDPSDFFRVTLAAGQTLQLDFSADTAANDLDLYVYRRVGDEDVLVGVSDGVSLSECVRVTGAGEYIVQVEAYEGASLYNLRIAAAGASGSCANSTLSAAARSVVPGQIITGLAEGSGRARAAGALVAAQPLSLLKGGVAPGRLGLMALSGDEKSRRRGLLALAGAGEAALRAARRPVWMDRLSADSRLQVETLQYAKRLAASGAFDYVTVNRPVRASALVGSFPPNDERYSLQRWHYEQIALPAAMDTLVALSPQPTQRPIVAVLDTGIVADHPDFAGQITAGYDFVRDAASAGDGNGIDSNPDDLQSADSQPSFHGTHVAGTVAAATYNGTGVAGVAPMAQVMAIRVLGKEGEGTFYDILQGLRYAAGLANDSGRLPARRADVANLSLGAEGAACDSATVSLIAQVRAQGTMIVAASGNESDRDSGSVAAVDYPANCAGVLAVTATDAQRGIAYYANGGPELALAAPGGDMRVATTGSGLPDGVYSTLASFDAAGVRTPTYGQYQGTSMATPHVAGVLALMRWAYPEITPAQVDALLQDGQLCDDAGATGHDNLYGWGIVDAAKAVRAALTLKNGGTAPGIQGVVEAQPSALDFGTATTRLEFTLRVTAATDETVTAVADDSAAVTVAAVSVDAAGLGRYRVSVDRSGLAAGVYTPRVTVTTSRRTLTIPLSIQKLDASAAADIGPIYVLVYDSASDEVVQQAVVRASGGVYRYRIGDVPAGSVAILAGSDYDNDGIVCASGEACGAWPVLGASLTPLELSADRSGLDFLLSALGIANAEAASRAASRKR